MLTENREVSFTVNGNYVTFAKATIRTPELSDVLAEATSLAEKLAQSITVTYVRDGNGNSPIPTNVPAVSRAEDARLHNPSIVVPAYTYGKAKTDTTETYKPSASDILKVITKGVYDEVSGIAKGTKTEVFKNVTHCVGAIVALAETDVTAAKTIRDKNLDLLTNNGKLSGVNKFIAMFE